MFNYLRKRSKIKKIENELYALTDRDLKDIGIHRSNIKHIARESVL